MRLFLLDGHALIFKMYYAFAGRPMLNSKGMDTSILFGFTKYLLELIEKEAPTHIGVAFDPPGGTFRNQLYPLYKANRGATPQPVIDALEPLQKICAALRVPSLMVPGFEADDVIGSMAKRCAREGLEVFMVTPDKDYGQLIEEHILQYKPGKGGEADIYDPARICEKYGIENPLQIIDLLAICGDASDNVPGVKGVGEVGASKLLARYGSVEAIYEHLAELSEKQQAMFEAARGHIALSKELVTIKTDMVLDLPTEALRLQSPDAAAVGELFDLYEFNSLRRKLPVGPVPEAPAPKQEKADASYRETDAQQLCRIAREKKRCGLRLEGNTLYAAAGDAAAQGSVEAFLPLWEDASVEICGDALKSLLKSLAEKDIVPRGRLLDTALMHYLLNPERSHDFSQLCAAYLGLEEEAPAQLQTLSLFEEEPAAGAHDYLRDARLALLLSEALLRELQSSASLLQLYTEIEEPLMRVLARMERTGVKIDLASLEDFARDLRSRVRESEAKVREMAGEPELNVSSPKQIGEVIFGKLKLDPRAKKPAKGSWPTDEETLQALSDRSPIIAEILNYRGLKKLLSTYIEPFPGYVSPLDGRVHTTFNQALTATGRLSSSSPNLQNIPIRTEEGRNIRKAFVPGMPDAVMMSADYSQIELRVMAHLSGDEHLKAAFRAGVDVHAATASKIFRVPLEAVTADQRRMAKTANFGIMYGISSFGLAQRLQCSRAEAASLIEDYFASFPAIRGFIDETLAFARREGYVQTLSGRRRYIPELHSHNRNIVAVAERNAVNAPIQGTAADIIKLAMIRVQRALDEAGLQSRLVLQIHDELLLEVPRAEISAVKELLVREMEAAMTLDVPLTVECNEGRTWLEAH
jgi:DNA polymerase-1